MRDGGVRDEGITRDMLVTMGRQLYAERTAKARQLATC